MVIYYYFFLILSLFCLIEKSLSINVRNIILFLISSLLIVFMGTRYFVGGDYNAYFKFYYNLGALDSFLISIKTSGGDIGYNLLSYLLFYLGFDVNSLNLISALIVVLSLIYYSLDHKYTARIFLISFPIFIIVVAMGYTRQSIAIGLFLVALTHLKNKKILNFFIFIIFASFFHKTAIILIPLAFLSSISNRKLIFVVSIIVFLILFYLLMYDDIFGLSKHYVQEQVYESRGAILRSTLNLLPALIFLFHMKHYTENIIEKNIYFLLSLASILIFPLVPFATTFFDRIGLYLIPLQFYVWGNLHKPLKLYNYEFLTNYIIIIIKFSIMFVWLNFAYHSYLWIPYKSVIIKSNYDSFRAKEEKFFNYRINENENDYKNNSIKKTLLSKND